MEQIFKMTLLNLQYLLRYLHNFISYVLQLNYADASKAKILLLSRLRYQSERKWNAPHTKTLNRLFTDLNNQLVNSDADNGLNAYMIPIQSHNPIHRKCSNGSELLTLMQP
jgi:hypothetical protein